MKNTKKVLTLLIPAIVGCTLMGTRGTASVAGLPDFIVKNSTGQNPFAKHTDPLPGPVKIFGGYANGCLAGAAKLDKSGPGYEVLRLSRNRFFGHPNLVDLLKRAGTQAPVDMALLYGDMSQPHGGPMPKGHNSHQMGLDVDVWFKFLSAHERSTLTDDVRENIQPTFVVAPDRLHVDANWTSEHERVLLWFAQQPEVDRIFVHPSIKKHLCQTQPHVAGLMKVRPWYGHDEHFHVRLKCPTGQPGCVGQLPVERIECDAALEWWFSPEAVEKEKEYRDDLKIKEFRLPGECEAISR